jgi:hypothetical protein
MIATIKPDTVVINATLIPPATMDALIVLASAILSNAEIIPITVPMKPNIGAKAMNKLIQLNPRSNFDISTLP